VIVAGAMALATAGCGKKGEPQQQAGQAVPVQVQPAKMQQVADSTEYLGTIRSRDAAIIMPQVEGHLTKIFVHSGEHVKTGQPLMQIDPLKQEATVNTQEATRQRRLAQLDLAKTELDRRKKLFSEGVISRAELDQAQAAYDAAKADADASQASVNEQKQQLRYYTVSAPAAGTLGDIPVRVGDRVTTTTQLTTIDSGNGLELYLSLPAEKSGAVHLGTAVEVLPETQGSPLKTKVTFVSPRLDEQNQLLLVKASIPDEENRFRNEQVVHARVIWREHDAIVLPVNAVSRMAGQMFAFVAEKQGEKTVAKQRRLDVGDTIDTGYVVNGGIKPGEDVIVSNVQILADGMPVMVMPAQPQGQQAPGQPGGVQ